ncbi:MAG: hypothetical protein WC851_02115 [Candidatus Shapirobacteria bacterium]|jgi:hypothetical protein
MPTATEGSQLKIIVCLTCDSTRRLAITSIDGVAAAKRAIGELPKHRGHYLDVIDAGGDSFVSEVAQAQDHFVIFPHVLHTHRNKG